jgi:hypothetical protein
MVQQRDEADERVLGERVEVVHDLGRADLAPDMQGRSPETGYVTSGRTLAEAIPDRVALPGTVDS